VIQEAPLEIPDDESEKEKDPRQPEKETGRRKEKTQAKKPHKKAATDQQDEEGINLALENSPTRHDPSTAGGTPVIGKTARLLTAKEKGKQVVNKQFDLEDSSDSDESPFSTRESGSSDESDGSDEEDGGEEPMGGKGRKGSGANDYLSIVPTVSNRLEPSRPIPTRHACTHTSTYCLLTVDVCSSCTRTHPNHTRTHPCPVACTNSQHLRSPCCKAGTGFTFCCQGKHRQGILSIHLGFNSLTYAISVPERTQMQIR
jgi:hypothetical protein